MKEFIESYFPAYFSIVQVYGEENVKIQGTFVGRFIDDSSYSYHLVIEDEVLSDGTSLPEYPLGETSGQNRIVGSG